MDDQKTQVINPFPLHVKECLSNDADVDQTRLQKREASPAKEPDVKRKHYDGYVLSTEGVISVAMVDKFDDFSTAPCGFAVKYSYHIFENEKIFGYKSLSVLLMFAVSDFQVFPRITSNEEVLSKMGKVDDVKAMLEEFLGMPMCQSEREFRQVLANQSAFKPFGRRIAAYEKAAGSTTREFEVYNVKEMSPGFTEYIRRIQFAATFFIEALNFTPSTDKRWEYYILYEKCSDSGSTYYATLGYCAVYNFYMYPDYVKPRIAQFMIMPQYQLSGHGKRLLQEVLVHIASRSLVWYTTVESPNRAFSHIYDFVEASNCSYLASFAPEKLKTGFSTEMKEEAFSVFKMSKERARRAYEILHLVRLSPEDSDELKMYDTQLKRRIYANIRAQTIDRIENDEVCETFEEAGSSASSGEVVMATDERTFFRQQYNERLEGYLGVAARLKNKERYLPPPAMLQKEQNGDSR